MSGTSDAAAGRLEALPVPRRARAVLLSAEEPGPRKRRGADFLLLVFSVLLVFVVSAVASGTAASELDVVTALHDLLGWADPLWRAVYLAALGYGVVLVAEPLVARRWRVLRDLALAVDGVVVVGLPLGRLVESSWPTLGGGVWSANEGYPAVRLAFATALLMVIAPELNRPARRLGAWLILLGGPSTTLAPSSSCAPRAVRCPMRS